MGGIHRRDVTILKIEWNYGGFPHEDGNDLAPRVWLQEFRELPHEGLGPVWWICVINQCNECRSPVNGEEPGDEPEEPPYAAGVV